MARPKLVYVSDQMPGIRRRGRGRGFEYRLDGQKVAAGERERIAALAIPPAWTDVWICPDPNGHLQAAGRDAKGRKQYRYHEQWRAERDEQLVIGARKVRFSFVGKEVDVSVVTSTDVDEQLRTLTGEEVTAKDFRTWGGTAIVTESLATSELVDVDADIHAAIDTAAEKLHNTRAVCRTSYVHPAVVEATREGRLHAHWVDSRSQRHLRRGEVTLLKILEEAGG